MTPIPEAIEKHWRSNHDLYCANCGHVAYIESDDLEKVRKYFDEMWNWHLEQRHSERKP